MTMGDNSDALRTRVFCRDDWIFAISTKALSDDTGRLMAQQRVCYGGKLKLSFNKLIRGCLLHFNCFQMVQ